MPRPVGGAASKSRWGMGAKLAWLAPERLPACWSVKPMSPRRYQPEKSGADGASGMSAELAPFAAANETVAPNAKTRIREITMIAPLRATQPCGPTLRRRWQQILNRRLTLILNHAR